MRALKLSLIATGDEFSPTLLERTLGVQFSSKHDRGEIAEYGRFKGVAYPHGSCIVELGSDEDQLEFVEAHIEQFKKHGATDLSIQIDLEYSDQCNLELSVEWLSRISKLHIPVAISCFMSSK